MSNPFDDAAEFGPLVRGGGGARQKVKRAKEPPPYKLNVWVELQPKVPDETTWLRTVENLSNGRVRCVTRFGTEMIVPRSMLP